MKQYKVYKKVITWVELTFEAEDDKDAINKLKDGTFEDDSYVYGYSDEYDDYELKDRDKYRITMEAYSMDEHYELIWNNEPIEEIREKKLNDLFEKKDA